MDPGDLEAGAHVIVVRQGQGGPWLEMLVGVKSGGRYDFPGGHLTPGEGPSEAASRELREETGISVAPGDLKYVGKFGQLSFYTTEVPPGTEAKAGSDEDALEWLPVDHLTGLDLPQSITQAALAMHEALRVIRRRFPLSESRRGLLVAFEGTDGAGKSTQVHRLQRWLEDNRREVVCTKWNSSPRLAEVIRKAKDERALSPLLYSLLHAADMVERYEQVVLPALNEGKVAVCDRYFYTSLVRDSLRGIDEASLQGLYRSLQTPDLVFHCIVPVDDALSRLTERQADLGYYAAGLDMRLSEDAHESCRRYLALMDKAYRRILPGLAGPAYCALDTSRLITEIAFNVRAAVGERLSARTLVINLIG